MANRGLSSIAVEALYGESTEFYHLYRFDFSSPLYITSAPYDIVYDDGDGVQTYVSNTFMLKAPQVTESLKIRPETIKMDLAGADASSFVLLLLESKNVDVYIYKYIPINQNLVTYSEQGDLWGSSYVTITPDDAIAPNGTKTADLFESSLPTGLSQQTICFQSTGLGDPEYCTTSIYVKRGNTRWVHITTWWTSEVCRQWFDLENLSFGNTGNAGVPLITIINKTIEDVGDGWIRISMSVWNPSRFPLTTRGCQLSKNNTNGFDDTSGLYVWLWGCQVSETKGPIPYQKTTDTKSSQIIYQNLFQRSEQIDNAYWSYQQGTIDSTTVLAPDNSSTAEHFLANTNSTQHAIIKSITRTPGEYTISGYFKWDGWTNVDRMHVTLWSPVDGSRGITFNLVTGEVMNFGGYLATYWDSHDCGNGWWRLTVSGVMTVAPFTPHFIVKTNTNAIPTGDGVHGFYVWGLQLTEGRGRKPYSTTVATENFYTTKSGEAITLFKGFTDSYRTSENVKSKSASASLNISNHWSNWDSTTGSYLSDADQQLRYPGDYGLTYSKITDYVLKNWGNQLWWLTDIFYRTDAGSSYPNNLGVMINSSFKQSYVNSKSLPDSIKLPIVYGKAEVDGHPIFRTVPSGSGIKYMWVIYALAEGECESLLDVTIDGVSIYDAPYAALTDVYFLNGSDTQAALPELVADSSIWSTDHRLRGIACCAIRYKYDPEVFPSDPIPLFKIKGKKLYDPRVGGALTWGTNPALVLYDYLTNAKYGKGINPADILGIEAGADYCETQYYDNDTFTKQLINLFDFHGIISTSDEVKKNVESILFSMRASLPWVSGKYTLSIERHDDASVYSFDENNITDSFEVYEDGIKSLANIMYYSVLDDEAGYTQIDVIAESAVYIAEDGRELKKSISNKYETNRYRAKNRAETELKKTRQQVTVELTSSSADALRVETGQVVDITRATQGWVNKLFRVTDMYIMPSGSIKFTMSEYEPLVYYWTAHPGTFSFPENTTIPNPVDLLPPTGLTLESGTNVLLLQDDGTITSRIKATWAEPNSFQVTGYNVYIKLIIDGSYTFYKFLKGAAQTEIYIDNVNDSYGYEVAVAAVNSKGVESPYATATQYVIGKTEPPSDVTGFTAAISGDRILLTWAAITDLDKDTYEIREGASWAAGSVIASTKSLSHLHKHGVAGDHVFWIKAVDTSGNYSVNAGTVTQAVVAPTMPAVTSVYDGGQVLLSWTVSVGSYPIDYYEVSDSSGVLAQIKGTSYPVVVAWASESFTVKAVDVNGIESSSGGTSSSITPPSVSSLTVDIVDNNVLLRWSHSLGTLPIKAYEIRRGAVFASADVLQEINGTFASFFENVKGEYVYWVVGIDSAGNYGTEVSVVAAVDSPPDYVLSVNWASVFDGTKVNCVTENGTLLTNVNATETWQQHFVNNGWATPQAQITAGYPYYTEPSPLVGSYTEEFDYGGVLSATLITVTLNSVDIFGSTAVAVNIQVKELIGDSYTDLGDLTSVYATNFRYVKITLTFTSGGGNDLLQINSMNVVLNSKLKNDAGSASITSASTGVVVNFNVPFVDVTSIVLSPNVSGGGTPGSIVPIMIYDFTDTPNPTSFTAYMYNSYTGAKMIGDFSWSARGY